MGPKFSLTVEYNSLVKLGKINFDPFQNETLEKLNVLAINISSKDSKSFFERFSKLLGRKKI